MRMRRPEAGVIAAIRSTMKRWPGPVSRKATSAPNMRRRPSATTTIALARLDSQPRHPRRRLGPGSASASDGVAIGSRIVSLTLEGLTERHVDDDARIAALRVQRRGDVDADRTEAGAVAPADTGAE